MFKTGKTKKIIYFKLSVKMSSITGILCIPNLVLLGNSIPRKTLTYYLLLGDQKSSQSAEISQFQ